MSRAGRTGGTVSDKKDFKVGGVKAPVVFMKGGSTSGKYDQEMAAKKADAERRRQHQDTQAKVAERHAGADGSVARLGSHNMMGTDSPRLLLKYLNRDKSVRQECISEITHVNGAKQGELDMMFSLVCPKCLERGLPQGESQLFVKNSHRKFSLDITKAGTRVVDSELGRQFVFVCGNVSVNDIVRCSNFNCTWSVRIDDSNVVEMR
jgi:hypothetical protein